MSCSIGDPLIIEVILPVIIILGSGYLFGRFVKVDYSPISKLSIVILSPALIFSFLVRSNLQPLMMAQIISVVLLFTIVIALVTMVVMKFIDKTLIKPALLATVFPNTGNIGLPILMFAYGEEAFSIGVVIVVLNFVLMYSLGIYFASHEGSSWTEGFFNIAKLPTTYATIMAVIVLVFHLPIPNFIYDPIKLVGDAMVPICLLILGIQLARTSLQRSETLTARTFISTITAITIIRLVISPVVILSIIAFFPVDPLTAKVLIVQHAMPTAVIMSMIAEEYESNQKLVANATFINTLFSILTITGILYFLEYFL